jgi:Glycosyltransferase family 87
MNTEHINLPSKKPFHILKAAVVLAMAYLLLAVFVTGLKFLGINTSYHNLFSYPILSFALIVLSAWVYHNGRFPFKSLNILSLSILGVLAAILYVTIVNTIIASITHLHEWDFLDFYISSSLAARGMDFYNPANFSLISIPIKPSPEFIKEVMQVGSKYPPPTVLFFIPFGFLSYKSALSLWYACNFSFLIASVIALSFLLAKQKPFWMCFIIISAMLSIFPGAKTTFYYAQLNFIDIFFLACFLLYQDRPYAGIFLGISILFRPFLGLLLVERIIHKKYKQFFYCIFFVLILCVLSFLFFGKDTFLHYFIDGPVGKIPLWMFSETGSVSLSAFLLRTGLIEPIWPPPYFHPFFLVMVILITAVTLFFVAKTKFNSYVRFAACITCGLILYPESGAHYGVFLIFSLVSLNFATARPDRFETYVLVSALIFSLQNFHYSKYFLLSMCLLLVFHFLIMWEQVYIPDARMMANSGTRTHPGPDSA